MERDASQRAYFHNLDGWRFVAFLTVFVSHAALFLGYAGGMRYEWVKHNILVNGDVGVSFFFVLSGFLITHLLLKEKAERGRISFRRFYARRALRIWPVYFLTLLAGFVILPAVLSHIGTVLPFQTLPGKGVWPWYLFFLANFPIAFGHGASVPTDVLWSISVEEQFYLLWPLIVSLLPRRHLPKALFTIIVAASAYRAYYATEPDVIAYSTFSVMADLAVGALLAWLHAERQAIFERTKRTFRWAIGLAYIAAAALIISRHSLLESSWGSVRLPIYSALIPLLLAFLFAFIIFEQNEAIESPFKMGRSRLATALGKISYGLYTYHMIAITAVLSSAAALGYALEYHSVSFGAVLALSSLSATILIAVISYRYMEKWFLAKKPR